MRSVRWTADALRARLRAARALECALPASTRLFAERRYEMLTIAANVESGATSAADAIAAYEEIIDAITPRSVGPV